MKNNLDLDDYSDDPDMLEAKPDSAGAKVASGGAAAAPLADKKGDDTSDEEEYLKEFERVKQQQKNKDEENEGKYSDEFDESPR